MEPTEVPTAEELRACASDLKSKMEENGKECKRVLKEVSKVAKSEGESAYEELFGMVVHDCVDSILKREVNSLAVEMEGFRNGLCAKLCGDETLRDKPMNLLRLSDGFDEAWKVWRSVGADVNRSEATFRRFVAVVSEEE